MVYEICAQTDKQTSKATFLSQYLTPLPE